MWKDKSVKWGERSEEELTDRCSCEFFFSYFFISRGKVTQSFPWKAMFKRGKESSNVLCSFIVNLIITNISVRDWGLKEVFCLWKYIKDKRKYIKKSGEYRKYSLWWGHILVMEASLSVVFSLPSLVFSKILRSCGISQISVGRRAALRATTSHGKRMMRMLLSFRKLLLYLYAGCHNAADLDRRRDSAPEEVAESRHFLNKWIDWFGWRGNQSQLCRKT